MGFALLLIFGTIIILGVSKTNDLQLDVDINNMSAMVLNAFKDSNSSGTIIGYVSLYRSRALKSRTCNFESSLVHKNLSLCTVTYGEKVLSFHNKCAATVHRVLFCFDKIDNIIINSNCRYCYEHNRKLNNHLRMWRYASEIYWQINLISTDESQLRNWLNKESQFKTNCSINQNFST